MGFHTFDPEHAERLDDEGRYRWCSAEELVSLVAPHESATVLDLGSGTGFYTNHVAAHAKTVYAVDLQSEMHELYERSGVPANVERILADVASLPFEDDVIDAAFSTMTYHEFASESVAEELARVLRPGARLVTVDWSRDGSGSGGPSVEERYGLDHAVGTFAGAGFTVDHAVSRTETFICSARR